MLKPEAIGEGLFTSVSKIPPEYRRPWWRHQSNLSTVASLVFFLFSSPFLCSIFSPSDRKISNVIRPVSVSLPLFIFKLYNTYIHNKSKESNSQLTVASQQWWLARSMLHEFWFLTSYSIWCECTHNFHFLFRYIMTVFLFTQSRSTISCGEKGPAVLSESKTAVDPTWSISPVCSGHHGNRGSRLLRALCVLRSQKKKTVAQNRVGLGENLLPTH